MKQFCFIFCILMSVPVFSLDGHTASRSYPDTIPGADAAMYNIYSSALKEGNRDKAADCALQYLSGIDSSVVHPDIAAVYDFLADYYNFDKYNFTESVKWYQRSMSAYGALEDAGKEARASLNIGKLRYKVGRYDKALEYVTEARNAFVDIGDKKGIAECCNILGAIYYQCRNYTKSNHYTNLFEDYARELNDTVLMVMSLNNLAVYANRIEDTLRSRSLISESISLCKKSRDTSLLCSMYLSITASFLNSGNVDSALFYIDLAEPFLRKIPEKGNFHYLKGVSDLMNDDDTGAEANLYEALNNYSLGEFDIESRKCHRLLEEIYRLRKDTSNAYRQLREYFEIDSRLEKENVFIDLFEYQNEIINQKEAEKISVKRNSRILYSVVVCFTLIITMILLYILRRTKQRNREEMRTQKEILEMKKMQEYSMNRLTEEVIEKISAVADSTNEQETKKRLHMISSELLGSRDPGQWKEVSQYIPEFNSEFYQNLIREFPSLTTNERRLCTLLNLNMSTKEIAQMTHQTPNSVKIARSRMRSKLGLTGSKMTIQEFLSKYN